jgi:hypothetical protein
MMLKFTIKHIVVPSISATSFDLIWDKATTTVVYSETKSGALDKIMNIHGSGIPYRYEYRFNTILIEEMYN